MNSLSYRADDETMIANGKCRKTRIWVSFGPAIRKFE